MAQHRLRLGAGAIEAALVKAIPVRGPASWTAPMLSAIADLGHAEGCCVDPPKPTGTRRGEFLWDLTISRWPPTSADWYDTAKISSPEIEVVVESEWGKLNSPKLTRKLVIDDFAKLLAARAPTKVMVFGYQSDVVLDQLTGFMCDLVDKCAVTEDAEYLLFGVAWSGTHYCARIHHRSRRPRDSRGTVKL